MSELRIINTHDQLVAAGGGIAVCVSHGGIRDTYVDGWQLYRVNDRGRPVVTDRTAAWYHHGQKWFSNFDYRHLGFHKAQALALDDAKRWIAKTYGEQGPWVRNAMRDYVPERVQKQFPIKRTTRREG